MSRSAVLVAIAVMCGTVACVDGFTPDCSGQASATCGPPAAEAGAVGDGGDSGAAGDGGDGGAVSDGGDGGALSDGPGDAGSDAPSDARAD